MNINQQLNRAWENAKQEYKHMERETWQELYPGHKNLVKSYYIMGWLAGYRKNHKLVDKVLSNSSKGDRASMTTTPFLHGFGDGFMSCFENQNHLWLKVKRILGFG